ncbi:hypothetical protein MRB53_027865 [Persea americana]|uniref:Uncharacterized protein n=1 Tax=Persea americana TaxID=3435 RepID=A0ACC2KE33_PERAE|nr:hypothetical protein MRB53_027865 [Persea americana]
MFDRNGDGQITKEELSESLENLGIYIPNKALGEMIEKTDTNGGQASHVEKFRFFVGLWSPWWSMGFLRLLALGFVGVGSAEGDNGVDKEFLEEVEGFEVLQDIACKLIDGWFWGKELSGVG